MNSRTEVWRDTSPNHALEPTPTAFAPTSLRLLARLTASVRLPPYKSYIEGNL
jgi:hypothetical protein